ncbi:hypothetical protein [Anaeromyxobacter paludicola]|nr:hypothetical protein [Anaeromyxobacter paludicola]
MLLRPALRDRGELSGQSEELAAMVGEGLALDPRDVIPLEDDPFAKES